MRSFVFVISAFAVMGLAFWAYHENYDTQGSIREVRAMHSDIGKARSRINMLQAEWAYLNRPDRLRDLVELNFDRLGLLPLTGDAFGRIDQITYPEPELGPILESIEVSSENAGESQ